ncbi:MAG: hypothetical protein U0872_03435 [Planctomycetaceae bacterium]
MRPVKSTERFTVVDGGDPSSEESGPETELPTADMVAETSPTDIPHGITAQFASG